MSRLAGWVSRAKPHGSSQSLNSLEEPSQIEHAMRGIPQHLPPLHPVADGMGHKL